MRKSRLFLVVLTLLCCALSLGACSLLFGGGGSVPDPLPTDAPVNLKITGTVLTWDAVDNAGSYTVSVNGYTDNVSATSFDLSVRYSAPKEYTVKVMTNGAKGYYSSDWSDSIPYIVSSAVNVPGNVRVEEFTLKWNSVSNSNGYIISIGDTETPMTATSYDLTGLTGGQAHTIKVKAVGKGGIYADSDWSEEVQYTPPDYGLRLTPIDYGQ